MTPLTLRADRAGERVDQFLSRQLPQLTRSAAQKLLEEGAVTLQRPAGEERTTRPAQGDELVARPSPTRRRWTSYPQDIPLDVVYEDGDVIAVNKPVGLVVHPAAGHPDGTLVNALLYHCGESLSGINGELAGPASSTASTGTPPASSSPPRATSPTWPWPSSSRTNSLYREYEAVCGGRL